MRPAYYFEFDNPAGTDRERFATFRLHNAWFKRLKVGRVVLLADTKTRQVYGKAKVLELDNGFVGNLLHTWAWLSHLEEEMPKSLSVGGRLVWSDERRIPAAERRFEHMVRRYGPARVLQTSAMTVIILKRTA